MDIYTHLNSSHIRKNIDKLDEYLGECMQNVCKSMDEYVV